MTARLAIAILLAVSIAAGAGCGGGGGDATGSSPRLSRAEFVKRANAVCKRERVGLKREVSRLMRLQEHPKPRPALIALAAHYVLLPAIELEMVRVAGLGIPPQDEKRVENMLTQERYELDGVAVRGTIPSIAAIYRPFGKSARLFRAYGLSSCANGPRPPIKGLSVP